MTPYVYSYSLGGSSQSTHVTAVLKKTRKGNIPRLFSDVWKNLLDECRLLAGNSEIGRISPPICSNANPNQNTNPNLNPNPNPTADPN